MRTNPVSFGSIMLFTINDGKPKAKVPEMIRAAFDNNPALLDYELLDTFYCKEEVDGTVYNAAPNFASMLDKKFREFLSNNSRKVIFTEAEFYVSPRDKEKRYFLTAPSSSDEAKIHSALSRGITLFAARFTNRR